MTSCHGMWGSCDELQGSFWRDYRALLMKYDMQVFVEHGLDSLDLVSELQDSDLVSLLPPEHTSW